MALPVTLEERAARVAEQQARQREAALARQEYEAKHAATRLKTERLRAERLEREAAEAAAKSAEPVKPSKRARR